ncbi:hypothetical protein [Bradyrhizobium retamae]|uniref:Uncharacterized protein n=1 Tax=Bradyrhizobium retamae TaxID=1300035 RepID=A0A0R3N7Q0_9BRAD|nr:hypothetical protein [Bradyrhizobium retamae]KRR28420.1 hypothetical protein CQ13_20715 [Bradyrhizobium retamae]
MLRMMLLGLLIPLGVGVLAAMELRTPARNEVVVVQPLAETTVGVSDSHISDSHAALAKADRLEFAAANSETPAQRALEHDPDPEGRVSEKSVPVFPRDKGGTGSREDHAQIKEIGRDDDSKKSHRALVDERSSPPQGISVGSSEPSRVINRHRHDPKSKKATTDARPKKVATAARPKSKPKTTAIKQATISERRKTVSDTEPCRLSAFGGLRKALNSVDCEI